MSGRECKAAIDCNGEIQEAITMVPLLVATDVIKDDDAIDGYNEMKEKWADEYRAWKARHIDFSS